MHVVPLKYCARCPLLNLKCPVLYLQLKCSGMQSVSSGMLVASWVFGHSNQLV